MKALVVIPNDSTYVAIWALERSVQLHEQGYKVTCLNLSSLDYLNVLGKIRRVVNLITYRNRWTSAAGILAKEGKFLLKKPSLITTRKRRYLLTEDEFEVFNKSLIASYAWDYGSSQVQKNMISARARRTGHRIFKAALLAVKREVRFGEFDLVTTINGRGFAESATIVAALEFKIRYEVLERVTDNWSYFAAMDTTSQDSAAISTIIERQWASADESEQAIFSKIGENYLRGKISRTKSSITSSFGEIVLDEPFIIFFPGSDYEVAAVPTTGSYLTTFKNQYEAFEALVTESKRFGIKVIVRVHPHVTGSRVGKVEDELWNKLALQFGVKVISSSNKIDSLNLASRAHTSVVYESSIGSEIAFLGLPLILTAQSTYAPFVPELQAFNAETMHSLIASRKIIRNPMSLVPWGYFMATGEILVRFFYMKNHDEIYFRDKLVDSPNVYLLRMKVLLFQLNDLIRGTASSRNILSKN